MPIAVSCPSCGTTLRAPESKAGKKAKCGKCGSRVRIPGSAASADSVGESQMLSAISMPGVPPLPDEEEPVPMAGAVEDFVSNPPAPARPSHSHPGRPAFGSGAGPSPPPARPKPEVEAKPKPSPAGPDPAPQPGPELLSLDDEPVLPCSRDPFAFSDTHVPLPKSASKAKQKAIEPAEKGAPDTEAADHQRGYVRPAQRQSGNLKYTAIIGTAAIAIAVVAVIVVLNNSKPVEQAKASAKEEEPQTPRPVEGKKDEVVKPGKEGGAPKAKDVPIAMLTLPRGGRELKVNPLSAKPELTQRPSGTPVQIEVPFDKVKRFFAPENRVAADAIVVWQAGGEGKFAVDTYSGTTGSRVGRIEFEGDAGGPLCDASTDGMSFVAAADGKITVWNLADKSRPVEGFDPYADKPEHKKAKLAAVYFGHQPSRLVTVSTAGAVHLFDLSTMKQVGEFIPPATAPGRIVAGKNVAADAFRASIVLEVGGVLYQLATLADLPLAWKHELGGEVGKPYGIAAAGVPGRIAFAFETDADRKKEKAIIFCMPGTPPAHVLHLWPAAAGEPTAIHWAGTSLAVIATTRGALWVDTEGKSFHPVAVAEVTGGKGLSGTTEVSHWYLVPSPGDAAKSLLLELALPMANFIDFRNAAEAKQPLATVRLDAMGMWK